MKVPARYRLGVCSHVGAVRSANEDDYLLAATDDATFLFAGLADGMGGLAGGAEASRTALRAIAAAALDPAVAEAPAARLRAGFLAASRRIAETSAAMPALRDMGTTATVLCLHDGQASVGHIGDTRLYRLRDERCELLTTDHAVRRPDNKLTRCLGGGRADAEPDEAAFAIAPGDRYLLVSDGVWSVVPEAQFARLAGRGPALAAAEALVAQALAHGGPDNATAVVVDVAAAAADGFAAIELPRTERPDERSLWPRAGALPSAVLPWLLFAAGVALAGHGLLQLCGVAAGLLAPFGG